jgi:trehalose-6-phosphate synthase
LRQCIPPLANKTVSNKRVQHKGKPLRVARRDVKLAVSINQTNLVGSVLIENTTTQDEKCKNKLGDLKSSLMPLAGDRTTVGEVVSTGRSDQSRKLEISIDHESFDVFASEERVREVKEVLTAFGNHVKEWAKS